MLNDSGVQKQSKNSTFSLDFGGPGPIPSTHVFTAVPGDAINAMSYFLPNNWMSSPEELCKLVTI